MSTNYPARFLADGDHGAGGGHGAANKAEVAASDVLDEGRHDRRGGKRDFEGPNPRPRASQSGS